jgi:hypothetical protein
VAERFLHAEQRRAPGARRRSAAHPAGRGSDQEKRAEEVMRQSQKLVFAMQAMQESRAAAGKR